MGTSCCRQKTTISVIHRTGSYGNRVKVYVVYVVMILGVVGVIVSILVTPRSKKETQNYWHNNKHQFIELHCEQDHMVV